MPEEGANEWDENVAYLINDRNTLINLIVLNPH
jgi:hypothetical protein